MSRKRTGNNPKQRAKEIRQQKRDIERTESFRNWDRNGVRWKGWRTGQPTTNKITTTYTEPTRTGGITPQQLSFLKSLLSEVGETDSVEDEEWVSQLNKRQAQEAISDCLRIKNGGRNDPQTISQTVSTTASFDRSRELLSELKKLCKALGKPSPNKNMSQSLMVTAIKLNQQELDSRN
jgi:hypothetical protein